MVRERTCEIILSFLEILTKNNASDLDEHLFLRLQINLVERLRDTDLKVQLNAIRAASILQVPTDKHCPIVNSFLYLLQHDSLLKVRLLICDLVAINKKTFELFRTSLIYDSSIEMRDRVFGVLYKKVSNKYFDAPFRRQLINLMLQDKNFECLEKFVTKWSEGLNAYAFLRTLDIEQFHENADLFKMSFVAEKLDKLMEFCFVRHTIFKVISDFNQTFAEEELFQNFDLSVHFHALLVHCHTHNKIVLLRQHLIIDPDDYWLMLIDRMRQPDESPAKSHILCYLIDSYFYLNDQSQPDEQITCLERLLELVDYTESNVCLVELILSRCAPRSLSEFIWSVYKREFQSNSNSNTPSQIKKCLCILGLFFSKLSGQDFNQMETLNESAEENVVEHLVQTIVLKNVSHLNQDIRALAVQALGLASLISYNIADSFLSLFAQVNIY